MTGDRTSGEKPKADESQAKSTAELLLEMSHRTSGNLAKPADHNLSSNHFLQPAVRLAAADSLIAPAKVEPKPKPEVTAGSMVQAYGGALGTNLKHQAEGMTGLLNTTQTSAADYQKALRNNATVQQDSALVSLFKSAGNIASNIDKVPEALKKQAKEYVNTFRTGDGNQIAAALGNTTAVLGTAFLPVGGASKAGTLSRETSILARGASEIKTVGTDIANYSAMRTASQAEDLLAATRVPRVPTRTALEQAAATNAAKDAGRVVEHLDEASAGARAAKPASETQPAARADAAKGNPVEAPHAPAVVRPPKAGDDLSQMLDQGTASLQGDGGAAARAHTLVPGKAPAPVELPHAQPVSTPAKLPEAAHSPAGFEGQSALREPQTVRPGSEPRITPAEPARPLDAGKGLPEAPHAVSPAKGLPEHAPAVDAPKGLSEAARTVETPKGLPTEAARPVEVSKGLPTEAARPVEVSKGLPTEAARPVEIPKAEAPVVAPKTEAPVVAPKGEAPVVAPKAEAPVVAPKAEAPVVAPKAEAPVVAPKAEAPVVAPKAEAPVVAPKAEAPVVAPKAEAPVAAPHAVEPAPAAPARVERTNAPAQAAETTPQSLTGAAERQAVAPARDVSAATTSSDAALVSDGARGKALEVPGEATAAPARDPIARVNESGPTPVKNGEPLREPVREPLRETATAPAPLDMPAAPVRPIEPPTVPAAAARPMDYGALSSSAAAKAGEGVKEIGAVVEGWTARAAESAHPELRGANGAAVRNELTAIENTVKNYAEGRGAETFVPDMRRHIASLEESGATTMARDLSTKVEQVERLSGASQSASAVQSASLTTGGSARALSTVVDDSLRTMAPAQREVGLAINQRLEEIGQAAIREPGRVPALVDELAKPEFGKFFAQSPELSTGLAQLKREASTLGGTIARADTSALTMERVAASTRLTEEGVSASQRVGQISRDIETAARNDVPAAARPVVERELKEVSRDLEKIAESASENRVIASIRQRAEVISEAGAPGVARELRQEATRLESAALNSERTRLMEQTGLAMQRDGEALGTQATRLQKELHAEGVSAPSAGSGMPVKSQVARHLDNIAEQSTVVAGATDQVAAVASMRNSLAKIEELGGASVLTPAQARSLEDISKLVGNIDRQAVEMRGLSMTQRATASVGERVPSLTSEINTAARVAGKQEALAPNLQRIDQAATDLRLASTAEQRAQAAARIGKELEVPAVRDALDSTVRGQFAQARLRNEIKALEDAAVVAQRERAIARLDATADNTAAGLRRAEADLERSTQAAQPAAVGAPQSAPSRLSTAVDDYARAVKESTTADAAVAGRRVEQAYGNLEAEATRAGLSPAQLTVLRADQEIVRQSLADLAAANRVLVGQKLEQVENGFRALEAATSTGAQRALIKQTYDSIQDLRYLEGLRGSGASNLEAAQTGLMRAKNDIEVATYRSNLVKLAASGDKQAQSQLLVAGLVTDGHRVTSLVPESFAPFSSLQTLKMPWQSQSPLRNLGLSDDFFVNNRLPLVSPAAIWTAKGVGAAYYGSREINTLSANIDAIKAEEENRRNSSLREPITFGNNARTVMRNAFTSNVLGRAVLNGGPNLPEAPVVRGDERTVYGIYENDPDKMRKIENMERYGTPFVPLRQGAISVETATPVVRAMSLPMKFNWSGDRANGGLDKPATSQFVIPSAMSYASPFALSGGIHNGRRDTVAGTQASIFGSQGTAGTTAGAGKAGADLAFAASMASYQEGASGHDVKDLAQVEESESGVDISGSAPSVQAHANHASLNHDDEDDDEDNGAATPSASPRRVPQVPAVAASPVAEEPQPAKKPMAGPPRKRTIVS